MKRSLSRTWSVLLSLVMVLGVVPSAPTVALAQPGVDVRIAVAVPLTEGATLYGTGIRDAIELAQSDYWSRLNDVGVTVTVVESDDKGDPSVASANAHTLVADPAILGVVGHVNSGCSILASQIYAAASLPMITPMSTNPALTQQGLTNVFRTVTIDTKQGAGAADVSYAKLRLTRAYVVDDSTPYGAILAGGFRSRYSALGGTLLGYSHTSDKQTNFSTLVAKIKAKNPKVVYYGGIYNAGALLARQLKAAGVSAVFVGADGLYDPYFVKIAGSTGAAGAISTNVGLPVDEMPGGLLFRAKYKAAYGHAEKSNYDAYAYDAAQAILKAMIVVAARDGAPALEGVNARALVRAEVAKSSFYGVTGRIGFNSVGDTKYPALGVYRVGGGVWRETALLGTPATPNSVVSGSTFTVSGDLRPKHTAGTYGAKLRFWHREDGAWVLRKTVYSYAWNSGVFSKYSARVRLTRTGSWRVSAEHSDAAHPAMRSTLRVFSVK